MRVIEKIPKTAQVVRLLGAMLVSCGVLASCSTKVLRAETVSGTIERFTTAPRGETDGAVLKDGSVIHWPPHVGESIKEKFKQGDRIEATGDKATGPDGDRHFEVQMLKDKTNDATLDVSSIAAPADGPRPPRDRREEKTVRGQIDKFTRAPRGEIDGAMLDNGTLLHWPPHEGEQMQKLISAKDRVEVTGRDETGPKGDRHFEVQKITNLKNDKSYSVEGPPRKGPRPPRDKSGANTTVTGSVKEFTKAPRGEVDGAILDDGTVIHWPPHREHEFADGIKVGQQIKVNGREEIGPKGNKRVEVDALRPATSGDAANGEDASETGRSRDDRLSELQAQLDQIQTEIEQLRREK